MNLKLSSIQHVGIPVTDLTRSINFYASLGFTPVMNAVFMHKALEGRVAMMQSGDIVIEIYQLPDPDLEDIRSRKNGHIDHIAFDTADIDACFLELKNAGFTIFEEAPVLLPFWRRGCRYFNIQGPDGERLEFNQIL